MGLTGENGDAPFPLQVVEIHRGVPVVDPARRAQKTAPEEHCLCQSGLSCVHVGQQADTDALNGFVIHPDSRALQTDRPPFCSL